MRAALIIGHFGKGVPDPGACADVNRDGRVEPCETEAVLNLLYGAEAAVELLKLGHQVLVLADGEYSERARRARAWSADIVAHLHLDVRPQPAGVVYYDGLSPISRGPSLAGHIAQRLGQALPFVGPVRAVSATPGSSAGATNLIELHRRDTSIAIVYEPARLTDAASWLLQSSRTELAALGRGLAWGVHDWSQTAHA